MGNQIPAEADKPIYQCRACKRSLGDVQISVKPDPDEKGKLVYTCRVCGGYVRLM